MEQKTGPIAEQRPHKLTFGMVAGEQRGDGAFKNVVQMDDPWFWLRDDDRKDEAVLAHLRKENEYSTEMTKHTDVLKQTLYDEHVGHLKETDDQTPYLHGSYFYYTRTVQGLSYKIHCRKQANDASSRKPDAAAAEEIILDENKVAEGKKHCDIRSVKPSPDHKCVAFAADFSGDEVYELRIIDLASGDTRQTGHDKIVGTLAWGDNSTVFYLTQDETKRPYRLWRHTLGTEPAKDELLFEEKDEQFWLDLQKSQSGRFVFALSASTETYEVHSLDMAAGVNAPLVVMQTRTFGLRYEVEHDGRNNFIIWTNKDGAINNRLMTTPITAATAASWTEVISYDESRKIDQVLPFKNFLALQGRQAGLTQLWILDVDEATGGISPDSLRRIDFAEELYEVEHGENRVFDTAYLRIEYSSLTTPKQWLDLDMRAGAQPRDQLIKEQEVLNFDRANYVCQRLFATAPDKTQIPMSMVYRKDLYDGKLIGKDGPPSPKPLHLYGYGSYGICIDPSFNRLTLPLLDRGMIFCIAHIRGGGEMGRFWYEEQGKYLTKRNTFSDFVACAEHLVDKGFTTPDQMSCEGRSAGGMLVGAVVNMRPDLFKAVVAGVPFVDVMATMCDPSIPLTTNEWEEWGNPNVPKYFDYMLSYSPMNNVRAQPYPHILITAGLHDPRVAYWEPAKWASKLRSLKTDNNLIVAKFDLESGHFSASDRYRYMKEKAYDQAFILDKLGLVDVPAKL